MRAKTKTVNGADYIIRIEHDNDADAPWEMSDGHGPVSEWTSRAKRPGERVLCSDRHMRRLYDIQAATEQARVDGWSAEPHEFRTAGLQAAAAVEADFEYLRKWCAGQWEYLIVCVEKSVGGLCVADAAVGGVESNDSKYIDEVIAELMKECDAQHESRVYPVNTMGV